MTLQLTFSGCVHAQMSSCAHEPQGKPKNTGVGSLSLLQWIFPTQESNLYLLHCRQILYQLSYQRSPGCWIQFSSVAQSCPTLCDPMNRSTPGLPVHQQLQRSLRLTSIESVMPSNHLILCHPLLLLPSIPPSIRVFSNESTPHEVAKVLEFQF